MATEAHMHNLDGSEWNAIIPATMAEVLAARATILRLHGSLHRTMIGGIREDGWGRDCNRQGEAQHLILRHRDEFPPAIVGHLRALLGDEHGQTAAIPLMQFLYAMILPLRKRKRGHRGVFFTDHQARS